MILRYYAAEEKIFGRVIDHAMACLTAAKPHGGGISPLSVQEDCRMEALRSNLSND
tara:strand:+ start:539 stop:706 length:168 start_codon:yes stop_codon:yes gene_type:complete